MKQIELEGDPMNHVKILIVAVLSMVLLTACSTSTMTLPNNEWQRSAPEEQGMKGDALKEIESRILETTDIVIARNGYIVYEYHDPREYMKGENQNAVPLYSVTKSITSALTGIAIDEGFIDGVDQKVVDFFPEWAEANPFWENITIEHLLTMTSGLEWPETTDWEYSIQPLVTNEDWVSFITDREFIEEPGEVFNYNTGGSHLLSAIIQEATQQSTYEYAEENLFDPLGIEYVEWREDPQMIHSGGEGLWMSAEDLARFALLYVNNGMWNGKQIVSEEWIKESSKTRFEGWSDAGDYGYHWWTSSAEVEGQIIEYYYALGFAGQFVFIVPEMDLTAVFTAQNARYPMLGKRAFENTLLPSIQDQE